MAGFTQDIPRVGNVYVGEQAPRADSGSVDAATAEANFIGSIGKAAGSFGALAVSEQESQVSQRVDNSLKKLSSKSLAGGSVQAMADSLYVSEVSKSPWASSVISKKFKDAGFSHPGYSALEQAMKIEDEQRKAEVTHRTKIAATLVGTGLETGDLATDVDTALSFNKSTRASENMMFKTMGEVSQSTTQFIFGKPDTHMPTTQGAISQALTTLDTRYSMAQGQINSLKNAPIPPGVSDPAKYFKERSDRINMLNADTKQAYELKKVALQAAAVNDTVTYNNANKLIEATATSVVYEQFPSAAFLANKDIPPFIINEVVSGMQGADKGKMVDYNELISHKLEGADMSTRGWDSMMNMAFESIRKSGATSVTGPNASKDVGNALANGSTASDMSEIDLLNTSKWYTKQPKVFKEAILASNDPEKAARNLSDKFYASISTMYRRSDVPDYIIDAEGMLQEEGVPKLPTNIQNQARELHPNFRVSQEKRGLDTINEMVTTFIGTFGDVVPELKGKTLLEQRQIVLGSTLPRKKVKSSPTMTMDLPPPVGGFTNENSSLVLPIPEGAIQGKGYTDEFISNSKALIKDREGSNLKVYKDSRGKLTVGTGHLVTSEDNLKEGDTISQEQEKAWFEKDYRTAFEGARGTFKNWDSLSQDLQEGLVSMTFQLGKTGVSKFSKFIRAVEEEDFITAKKELENSDWAKQTPKRVEDLIDRLPDSISDPTTVPLKELNIDPSKVSQSTLTGNWVKNSEGVFQWQK